MHDNSEYVALTEISGELREINKSLDLVLHHKADVFKAAALILPRLIQPELDDEEAYIEDRLAVERAVSIARSLFDQVYEPQPNRTLRAKQAESMPSNSGPLVGDETVYLGEAPKPFAPWEDQ